VKVRLKQRSLETIDGHAARAYPHECCGAVIGDDVEEWVRPIRNIQDDLHRQDPASHPRDARIAYFMDPTELGALLREIDHQKRPLRIFYHSHPDHDAYFSAEDKERAMAWDEPAYPEAVYLVVSVKEGVVGDRIAVAWDPERLDFVPVELSVE
jgi:proteasome lid subunit RPN8/RPN11